MIQLPGWAVWVGEGGGGGVWMGEGGGERTAINEATATWVGSLDGGECQHLNE